MPAHDLKHLAERYFKLRLPTTIRELKTAFRKESSIHHPDKGGDGYYFGRMVEAYRTLIDPKLSNFVLLTEAEVSQPMTEEGILLSDLGLGCDGTPCPTCDSKGYTTVSDDHGWIKCKVCRGTGFSVTCPRCQGSGKFARGQCFRCLGAGRISLKSSDFMSFLGMRRQLVCPNCMGEGAFKSPKTVFRHYKCGDCDGKGERSMFNPLIPKNRMHR